jgi:hypothetical protein
MRLMSFALTTEQVRARTKTVTRRLGWTFLRPGDLVQPVVKGQGLKKGERVEKIGGPIRIDSVRREPLDAIVSEDVRREGFANMRPRQFVEMFRASHGRCAGEAVITRIEFSYVDRESSPGRTSQQELKS